MGPDRRSAGPTAGPHPVASAWWSSARWPLFTLGFKSGGFGGKVTAPAGTSAAKGNAALAANFPQSSANPTNVIMRFPTSVWDDPQQLAVATDGLATTGEFTTIAGPLDPNGTTADRGAADPAAPGARAAAGSWPSRRTAPAGRLAGAG